MAAMLAVQETGTGEPLVLVHGIATDRRIWSLVVPALALTRRVITVDVPGFGASEPVAEDFDLEQVAERIARGLAARGIRGPFDLVGHSLGGGIAMTLAADRPRMVRRLVLVAPAGLRPYPAPISNLLAATADAALAARRSVGGLVDVAWGRRLLLSMTAADAAQLPPTLARKMVDASAGARRTGPALATITRADLRPVLAQVRAPVGIIWGEADRTVPIRALDQIAAVRPDATVIRLAGAGHVPMVEMPEAFADALRVLLVGLPQDVTSSAA